MPSGSKKADFRPEQYERQLKHARDWKRRNRDQLRRANRDYRRRKREERRAEG